MLSFFRGIRDYGSALRMIFEYRLWKYLLVPVLVSLVLGVGIFTTAYFLGDQLGDWIMGWYPWERGTKVASMVLDVFGGVLVVALGLILFKNLVIAFAGPFMSPLSERVELIKTGQKMGNNQGALSFMASLIRGLRIAIRLIVRELLITLGLLILGLIPILTPFTTILIFVFQAYFAGSGNIDYALERRYNFRDSVRFTKSNRLLAIGNGAVYIALLLVGIGFIAAVPLGAMAATISTIDMLDGDKKNK